MVEESANLLRASLPNGVELRVTCSDDAPCVQANSTRVEQAILNIVINSVHAMKSRRGCISIALEAAAEHELERSVAPGHYARITIRDTGEGMDARTLERVFEPFFSTKPRGEGTGLGLSIVRDIMQEHRGFVCPSSEPGRGTIFRLYFPAVALAGADAAPTVGPRPRCT